VIRAAVLAVLHAAAQRCHRGLRQHRRGAEPVTDPERPGAAPPPDTEQQRRRPWLTRNVKVLSTVSFLQDSASELLYPILPIFLTTVLGAPVAAVGAIEGVADWAAAISKTIAGRLADRWPRPR
jgi:hypothetical protein